MDITILGGGVAGVGSAIALAEKGFRVNVYERHPAPSTLGAGIVVWPNAAFVLEQLGLLEAIAAVSGRPSRMQRRSSDDQDLGAIDIGRINRRMGYTSLSILRTEFHAILLERLAALGIGIHYGHACTSIIDGAGGRIGIEFQNGEAIAADIAIGADGRMASVARRYVNGDNTPVFQRFINWIGVFEAEDEVFGDDAILDYWGVGKRFGLVPITPRKAYWAGGMAADSVGERRPEHYRQELGEAFGQWPGAIARVIAETPLERINKIYVHDHQPVQPWHRNRLLMIGDAAHAPLPTSGQGACQALEDAWHLANCLAGQGGDLERAFRQFTRLRHEKTTGITMAARSLANSLFNTDADACRERDRNSLATDYDRLADSMAALWGSGLPLKGDAPPGG